MTTKKRSSLGRNLQALLARDAAQAVAETTESMTNVVAEESNTAAPTATMSAMIVTQQSILQELALTKLQPGQYQPRRHMDEAALEELAISIKAQGIIQPIVVRPLANLNDHYEIVAGERRFQAAKRAGLTTVPVLIRSLSDEETMALALIENIQRQDLNVLEEAMALERLIKEFKLTHQEIAEMVGRSRAAISNLLRLLSLNGAVKELLVRGDLEMGHARALLTLSADEQIKLSQQIVAKGLSVREAEALVKHTQQATTDPLAGIAKKPSLDPDVLRLQQRLSLKLHTKVQIQHKPSGKGRVLVKYKNIDELERILFYLENEPYQS